MSALEMIEIYTDGACLPHNPGGVATYGWVAYQGGKLALSNYGVVGEGPGMTNNLAEYSAVINALESLEVEGYQGRVKIFTDSMLIVNQLTGYWRAKHPVMRQLVEQVKELLPNFYSVRFYWIPREKNEVADGLSEEAYRKYIDEETGI